MLRSYVPNVHNYTAVMLAIRHEANALCDSMSRYCQI